MLFEFGVPEKAHQEAAKPHRPSVTMKTTVPELLHLDHGSFEILFSIEKRSPTSLGTVAMRSEVATRNGTLKKCGTVTVARRRIFILIKTFSNNSWLRPSCAMTMWPTF